MDQTSNLLTSLRNAELAGLASTEIVDTKFNCAILTVLQKAGIIVSFAKGETKLLVTLVKPSVRHHFKGISKPSRRIYVGARKIPTIRQGQGMVILSTSAGVLSGFEARKLKLGGELICEVY